MYNRDKTLKARETNKANQQQVKIPGTQTPYKPPPVATPAPTKGKQNG